MVSPILRLGYRPETFSRPPPTRRVGLRERTSAIAACVFSVNASRLHQPKKSASLSTRHLWAGHQGRGRLLSVSQIALILQRQRVPSAGFSHEFQKIAAVADSPFQILGQVVWHVYGKPAIPLATIQCIAGVSLAGFTNLAALSDAGTLPQRQRSNGYRPEILNCSLIPESDLFRGFCTSHC